MGGKTNGKAAVSVLLVVCLIVTQLELTAFGQTPSDVVTNTEASTPSDSVSPKENSETYPVAIAQAQPPAPAPTAPTPAPNPPPQTVQPASRGHFWRWVIIGVGATAAIVATIIWARDPKSEGVITVGAPTIGNP